MNLIEAEIKDTCEVKIETVLFIAVPSLADQPLNGVGQVHIRKRVRHVRVSDLFGGRRTVDNNASRSKRLVATACYYVRLDVTTYLRTFIWNKNPLSSSWCACNGIKCLTGDQLDFVRSFVQKQFEMFMKLVSKCK